MIGACQRLEHRVLVRRPGVKSSFSVASCRWEENSKIYLKETGC
jgi:hypothetical protein